MDHWTERPTRPTPPEVAPLAAGVRDMLRPVELWMFGSRARGDHRLDSDWDLLAVLPDDAPKHLVSPLAAWDVVRRSNVPATLLSTTLGELHSIWGLPNTIGYDLAREGIRLAAENARGAASLLASGNRNAAYQAEQAVEQIILALAQSEGVHIPRSIGHQLDAMVKLIPEANPCKLALATLTWLEAFATGYRYPRTAGAIPSAPDDHQVAAALARIDELMRGLSVHFGVDAAITSNLPAMRKDPPRNPQDRVSGPGARA